MTEFVSLKAALKGCFDNPLEGLTGELRARIESDLFLLPWDQLTPEQRRMAAEQWDYQHDPETESDREYWWNLYVRQDEVETEISRWEATSTPTASDLKIKQDRIAELKQKRAALETEERSSARRPPDGMRPTKKAASVSSLGEFIAYPLALRRLAGKFQATADEIAAWVFMGPKHGGLAAYTNANELDSPPRFYFDTFMGVDYIAPLMACWFKVADIAGFTPADRYISGRILIERWAKIPEIRPEAYIAAKVAESRLAGIHPIFGGTQADFPGDPSLPPMDAGLFVLAHVEEIEALDFGITKGKGGISPDPGSGNPPVGSAEWRKHNASVAAVARHAKPGGNREKQQEIRCIWASGKYSSRDRCAEQECEALGMSFTTARKALRNTPDPSCT